MIINLVRLLKNKLVGVILHCAASTHLRGTNLRLQVIINSVRLLRNELVGAILHRAVSNQLRGVNQRLQLKLRL